MSSSWILNLHGVYDGVKEAPLIFYCLEVFVITSLLWIVFQKTFRSSPRKLSKEEEDALIEEWNPEPLVGNIPSDHPALKPHIISGKGGHYIVVDNHRCLNLATHNYLGFVGRKDIEETAIKSIAKYGVGSCGPRGFYGTVDVHLDLEEKLAKFMGMEEAVVYSYGFSTVASAIPAYAKRTDVIFVDEAINFAIQQGVVASRSKVYYFRHNSPEDLERVFKEHDQIDRKKGKKGRVSRRFLIVEGVYMNTGNVCLLPPMVELAHRFKARIFIDESVSFATLGETGRGITQHYGIKREEIDLIIGSMDWALGSIGGFCVGSHFIVEHQRLSGLGYCFSASLPPLLTTAAVASLKELEEDSELIPRLHSKCRALHSALATLEDCGLHLQGHPLSVVKHLRVADCIAQSDPLQPLDSNAIQIMLRNIANECIAAGVGVVTAAYLDQEKASRPVQPGLRITVNADLTSEEIDKAIKVIRNATVQVVGNHRKLSAC